MSTLTGTSIALTYPSLIKIGDNTTIDSTLKRLSDGIGSGSALLISDNSAQVSGSLSVVGGLTANLASIFYGGIIGSLTGNATTAGSATTAQTASAVANLNQTLVVTGSVIISGSANAVIVAPIHTASPTGSLTGSLYINTTTNKLYVYTGNGGVAGWVTASLG